MARKSTRNVAAPVGAEQPVHHCRECANAYNWYSKSFNGNMVLCFCKYHHNGEHCKLLADVACKHFVQR